ncbi:hypothetical protein RB623_19835 [Mesorhizobium sp. LHD-90]|uniref:hypothetical protein n=1 Tax=Mesorhizobium sp. LHD-90 TaxID=3071414 RepID=UPI0027E1693C|nr:hypothetical protein [Mesorhizobium sp. LHD-90]MDQ6436315.1 hypothetical protein [Mesorhizobium sp. LHD-90]
MRAETLAGALAGLIACAQAAVAAYTDPNVLTIEGGKQGEAGQYHIERLRSDFENVAIETRTPWTKDGEVVTYRGPKIADILREHELDLGKSVQFIAYDNFTSEVTVEEIQTYNPIFAIDRACVDTDRQSGRCAPDQSFTQLAPEEQGPIFLVWPYEDLPESYVPARNSIWVWFVVAVRPSQ